MPTQRSRTEDPTTAELGPKSARTRVRILDAAARVLSGKGFAGTRLSDIADEAGIQAPAIYYYFASREELVEEVLWVGSQQTRQHVTDAVRELAAEVSPLDRVLVAARAHLRYILEISDYATATARNSGQVPLQLRRRQASEQTKYGDLWRDLINDAIDAGQLRPGLDASAARMLVLGALNWTPEWWDPRRGSMERVVQTAEVLIRFGLGTADADVAYTEPTGAPVKASLTRTNDQRERAVGVAKAAAKPRYAKVARRRPASPRTDLATGPDPAISR